MRIKNLKQFKLALQKVLIDEGFVAFCKKCPIERCCNIMKPTCDYVIQKRDCLENKPLECHFFICPVLNKKNPEVSNWLMRIKGSISWPNKLEFPFEMEEWKKGNDKNS